MRDGRDWLEGFASQHAFESLPSSPKYTYSNEIAIQTEEVWFRYEQDLPDVVKGLSLKVRKGEFLALLGGNGTG